MTDESSELELSGTNRRPTVMPSESSELELSDCRRVTDGDASDAMLVVIFRR